MRKIVTVIGVALVITAIVIYLYVFAYGNVYHQQNMPSIGTKLVIEVHHANGTIEKYEKEGDLILKNFVSFVVRILYPANDNGTLSGVKKYTGVSGFPPSYFYTSGRVCVGNGTTPATIFDYKLESEISCSQIDSDGIILYYDDNDIIIRIRVGIVVEDNVSISEIGLLTGSTSSSSYNNIYRYLIMRDVLETPIELSANDTLIVTYYIRFDNP